jgi:hypothetical protein
MPAAKFVFGGMTDLHRLVQLIMQLLYCSASPCENICADEVLDILLVPQLDT